MSAFSHRKRPRRLGEPIFSSIEDHAAAHAPPQPLADLTADLDAALAERPQCEHVPAEPPKLLIPDEVLAIRDRVRRSKREVNASPQPRYSKPDRVAARTNGRAVGASTPTRIPRPTSSPGGSAPKADIAGAARTPVKRGASEYRTAPALAVRETSTPYRHAPSQTRNAADAALAERPVRPVRSAPLTSAKPLPAELLAHALELPPPARRFDPPPIAGWFSHPLVIAMIGVISVAVIALAWMASPPTPILSFQHERTSAGDSYINSVTWSWLITQNEHGGYYWKTDVLPSLGDHRLRAAPSLSPAQIDQILHSYGSPAAGTGEIWYRLGVEYNIDPAYAVAFFIHESGAGTNPNWAGRKPDGSTTHNIGNIICAGYPTCYGRFRDYPDWETGIADWYRLIDVEYIRGRGLQTVAEVIPVYAPAFENDVQGYIDVVTSLVDRWRAGQIP